MGPENEQMLTKGFMARVYWLNPQEKTWFSNLDLSRRETSSLKNYSKLFFYSLKIAQLLFPNNFIKVGAVRREIGLILGDYVSEEAFAYSKLARINPDHFPYSKHMDFDDFWGRKVSPCKCPSCERHRKFHNSNLTGLRIWFLTRKFAKAGIEVPADDPTDYCQQGKTFVFFEINSIDLQKVRQYLKRRRLKRTTKKQIYGFLRRLEELSEQKEEVISLVTF